MASGGKNAGRTAQQRLVRAGARAHRGFGLPPPGFVPTPKHTLNFRNTNVRLVPADSEEGKQLAEREKNIKRTKITKVAVDTVVEGFEGPDTSEPGQYKGEFAPNIGTPFEGLKFLTMAKKEVQLTENDLQCVLYMLRDGASRGDASDIIGINAKTLDKLADRNPLWMAAMRRAEALGKLALIARIRDGDSHWQSAAWMLERKHYKEYGINNNREEEDKVIRVRPVTPGMINGKPAPSAEQLKDAIPLEEQRRLLESTPITVDEVAETNESRSRSSRSSSNGNGNGSSNGSNHDDEEQIATTDISSGIDQLIDRDGSQIDIARRKTIRSKASKAK